MTEQDLKAFKLRMKLAGFNNKDINRCIQACVHPSHIAGQFEPILGREGLPDEICRRCPVYTSRVSGA